MALLPEDLGVSNTDFGNNGHKARVRANGPARFDNVALGPTLLQWSPLTYDTTNDQYIAWVDGAVLDSFVAYGDIKLDATDQVIGVVPVEYDIDLDQFVVNGTTQTAAALKTAAQVLNEKFGPRRVRNISGGSTVN